MRPFLLATCLLFLAAPTHADAPAGDGSTPQSAVLADLPFLEDAPRGRIAVDLAAEGNPPLALIVDTGASVSRATPRAAVKLGLPGERGPAEAPTLLGRPITIHVDGPGRNASAGAEPTALGGDFLSAYVLEFDFAERRLRFLDPERFEVPAAAKKKGEAVLPIGLEANRPSLGATVQGKPTRLWVDTGSPLPVILSQTTADAVGPLDALSDLRGAGVHQRVKVQLRWLDSLALGGFAFDGLPAMVLHDGWNREPVGDSVVGVELLSEFKVRIDYPRKRIWLARRPSPPRAFNGVPYVNRADLIAKMFRGAKP